MIYNSTLKLILMSILAISVTAHATSWLEYQQRDTYTSVKAAEEQRKAIKRNETKSREGISPRDVEVRAMNAAQQEAEEFYRNELSQSSNALGFSGPIENRPYLSSDEKAQAIALTQAYPQSTFFSSLAAKEVLISEQMVTIRGNNKRIDLLIDSDCRKIAGDPYRFPRGTQAITFPILHKEGQTCRLYAVEETGSDTQRQAILCLDHNGDEVKNCQQGCVCLGYKCARKVCPPLDCSEGSCANIGLKWLIHYPNTPLAPESLLKQNLNEHYYEIVEVNP